MTESNQESSSQWCRFEYIANGQTSAIGCFYPEDIKVDKATYPHHIFIGYGYADEGSAQLPDAAKWLKINAIERTMTELLKAQDLGFLLFTIASDGYYQWNIYSTSGEKTALVLLDAINKLAPSSKVDQFDYEVTLDTDWAAYLPVRENINKALKNLQK